MKRKFVETEIFQEDLANNGIDSKQVRALQNELLENPDKGILISGTGGSRKVRMRKPGKGKSGSFRILYTDFKRSGVIYLWLVFGKQDQENLTAAQKAWIKGMNADISSELKKKR